LIILYSVCLKVILTFHNQLLIMELFFIFDYFINE